MAGLSRTKSSIHHILFLTTLCSEVLVTPCSVRVDALTACGLPLNLLPLHHTQLTHSGAVSPVRGGLVCSTHVCSMGDVQASLLFEEYVLQWDSRARVYLRWGHTGCSGGDW